MSDSPSQSATAEALQDFIQQEILFGQSVRRDEDLLLSGLIDSISVMNLVGRVEEILGSPVPPEDVTLENFVSVDAMTRYIDTKKAG